MNRRGFLGLLGAAAAGFVLDPELALWKPGVKTIFIPPAGGWAEDGLLTLDWITKEALRMLQRNLVFSSHVDREYCRDAVDVGNIATVVLPLHRLGASKHEVRRSLAPAVSALATHLGPSPVFTDLPLPHMNDACVMKSRRASIRAVAGYDIVENKSFLQLDTLVVTR